MAATAPVACACQRHARPRQRICPLIHPGPFQVPESLSWAPTVTGIEALVLYLCTIDLEWPPLLEHITGTRKWVRWAAGLPRLRRVELRVGEKAALEENDLLCKAVRGEGEGVEAMLPVVGPGRAALHRVKRAQQVVCLVACISCCTWAFGGTS